MAFIGFEHGGQEGPGHEEKAFDIGFHHLEDIGLIRFPIGFQTPRKACIIQEDIRRSHFFEAPGGDVMDFLRIPYVQFVNGDGNLFLLFYFFFYLFQLFFISRCQDQIISFFCQGFCRSETNPAGSPCDECKMTHFILLLL